MSLHSRPASALFFSLLLVALTVWSLVAVPDALALTATDVQILMVTDPLLVSDSNGCAGGDGPQSAYVGFKITNTSGATLSNLSVNLSTFDAGFGLAGGQAASQYIGTLAAGASDIVYWFLFYPCHTAADTNSTLTVTVSDGLSAPYAYSNASAPSATTTDNVTTTIQSVSTISANAGGLYQSSTLGPGAVIGQIIPYDVTYSFGGAGAGDRYQLQPTGESNFNAGCFQLANNQIIASTVNAIAVGSTDDLFYYANTSQPGSGYTVTVRYYFIYLCDGVSTSALPYASQTSGSTNVKYAESGYTAANQIIFPPASNAYLISKTATPTNLPAGGIVTYTVLITNTSVYNSSISRIDDLLPAGVTFAALQTGAGQTSPEIANLSSIQPAAGASGTLQWQGGRPSVFPYDSYYVPAKGTLKLVYTANVPPAAGSYLNTVTPYVGSTPVGSASSTVGVGQADVSVTKSAPATAVAGDLLTYTIDVVNAGPGTTSATLSDPLPSSVSFQALTAPASWSCTTPAIGATGTISCSNPAFAVGTTTFSVQVRVGAGLAGGSVLSNTATVTSSLFDPDTNDDTATAITTITAPSLAVTKRDSLANDVAPVGFSPGDTVEYEIIVSNSGNGAASGVTFFDTPGANTALVVGSVNTTQGTITSGNTAGNTSIAVDLGTIPGLSTATVRFQVTIANPLPAGVTQFANQGRVEGVGLPPLLTDDPDTLAGGDPTITSVTAEPILSVSKSDSLFTDADGNGVPSPGDTLLYQLTIINSGNGAATTVTLSDTPDIHTALVVGSVSSNLGTVTLGNTADDTSVAVNLGTLPGGGASATVSFQVTVANPLPAGVTQVANQALVSSAELPPASSDDPGTPAGGDPTITPLTAAPDIQASKSDSLFTDADGNGVVSPGDTLLYNITIRNNGNGAGLAAFANDLLDPHVALVIGSVTTSQGSVVSGNTAGDTSVAANLGTLPGGGASTTVSFQVTITNPLPAGVTQVANQALISGSNFPSVPSDDPSTPAGGDPTITSVTAEPILSVSKSDSLFTDADGDGVPSPGDTLLYQVTIINSGNSAATTVTLSDTPDTHTALVVGSVSSNRGTVTNGNTAGDTSVAINLGTLPGGGASATVSFQVTVANPLPAGVTQVANQALVSSAELPPVPSDDPSTPAGGDPTITPLTAAPILSVSKSDNLFTDADGDGVPSPGDTVFYQITIINSGNSAATTVTLSDTPDIHTALVVGSVSSNRGTVTLGNTAGDTSVAVTIGTLPGGGASATVSFQVTIANPLPAGVTQVANQALVSSAELPPASSDDPGTPAGGDPTITPLTAAPILSVSKSDSLFTDADGDGVPSPGDTLLYQLTIINSGNSAATTVTLSDTPDIHTALVVGSVSSNRGTVTSGNTAGDTSVAANLGTLPGGGASATVSFQVTVANPLPAGVTQVANQALVSSAELPPASSDDPGTPAGGDPTITPLTAVPILSVSKSDSLFTDADGDGVPSPGDTLLYQLTIINSGNGAATNVALSDTPDIHTALVVGSVSSNRGTVTSGNTAGDTSVAANLGTLPGGGASATVSFQVTIANPLPAGVTQVANQALVSSAELPPASSDDPGTPAGGDPTITSLIAAPDIQASKSDSLFTDADGNGVVSPGDTLLYNITIRNNGNGAGLAAFANDLLDPHVALVIGSVTTSQGSVVSGNTAGDTNVAANLGTLPGGGASTTVSFQVTITNPLPAGVTQVANQALISGSNFPSVPSDDPSTPASGDPTITPLTAAPILSVSKSDSLFTDADGDGVPSPGDTLLYQVTIINSGNSAATTVTLSDTPDIHTALVVGSVSSNRGTVTLGNTAGDTSVAVAVGTLPGGGASATVSFQVTVANPLPAGVTQVANQALVSSAELPPVPSDDPSTPAGGDPTITSVTAEPILSVSKSDSLFTDVDGNGVPSPGDTVFYQLTIINSGNGAATNVALSDTPDIHTALVVGSVSSNRGTVTNGNTAGDTSVAVNLGTLPGGGASATVSFQVTVANPLPAGVTQVANQALVSSAELPPASSDDPGTPAGGDPTITPLTAVPILSVSKSDNLFTDADGDGVPSPGDTLLYQVTIINSGNSAATTVALSDTPDVHTALVVGSVSSNRGTVTNGNTAGDTSVAVTIGSLPGGGASATVSFQVTVANPLPAGVTQVANQALVSSAELPPASSDDPGTPAGGDPTITSLIAAPDLRLTKDDGGATALPGRTITYTLSYANGGTKGATGVVITETVPANTNFVAGSSTTGWSCADSSPAGATCTFNIGTLAAGASGSVTFAAQIVEPLPTGVVQIANTALVSDDGTNGSDPTPNNNTAAVITLSSPTMITLTSFAATRGTDGVTITWVTGMELETFGFVIYRGSSPQISDATQVTATLILATGINQDGASYRWVDRDAPSAPLFYWLVDIDIHGNRTVYGPFTPTAPGTRDTFSVYMPLVLR